MSFQQGIDVVLSSQGVDIAVFILWSRLGSAVGSSIPKADGTEYRSGTEREYDLMMQARGVTRETEGKPRPAMLVYTRRDDASFAEALRTAGSTAEQKKLLHQKELVESFIQETFQDSESNTNIGAYISFDRPSTFSQRLRTHLQAKLDEIAGGIDIAIWDTHNQGPPFLGLAAFQPKHADVFFGREEEILEARNALRQKAAEGCAFLLLSGASGSGKSSLACAGILPEIVRSETCPSGSMESTAGTIWLTLILTPAELAPDPITALVRRLTGEGLLPGLHTDEKTLEQLVEGLRKDAAAIFPWTIKKALADIPGRDGESRMLIVLDQLEELFTSSNITPEARLEFLNVIEVFARSGSIWIVATLRSDFYQQLQSEPALVRMKEGRGLLDVLPPRTDSLQRVIEEPARLAGLVYESRDGLALSSRILKDAAPHAELLPLLEFVLRELYENRADERQLTFAAYDALGGVEGALANRAEETFAGLPPDSQQALERVLRSLVTLGTESADGSRTEKAVRQYAPLSRFENDLPAKFLIDRFISARLFTTGQVENSHEPAVSVAHESLLRVWKRAMKWKDKNLDFLRTRARIASRMKEGSPLLTGDPLLEAARTSLASHAADFTTEQREWVVEAVSNADSAAKRVVFRRRVAFATLSALTLVAIAGGGVAFASYRVAKRESEKSERSAQMIGDAHESSSRLMADVLVDLRAKLEPAGQAGALEDTQRWVYEHFSESEFPGDDADSLHMRSVALNSRGYLARKTGDYAAAEDYYTRSLAIRMKLLAMDPDKPLYQHNLAIAHDNLGDLHLTKGQAAGLADQDQEYKAAIGEFREALKLSKKLTELPDATRQWFDDLAVSHLKVGGALFVASDVKNAEVELLAGFPIAEKVAKSDDSYPKWQANLGYYCLQLGNYYSWTTQPDKARPYLLRSKSIFEELDRKKQMTRQYAKWQAELTTALLDIE